MGQDNEFLFRHSRHLPGVTALHAVMRDFSYERHAHEEIALGVTLEGRQHFICRGVHYESLPGNVILFNPGEVHDGHPGGRATLRYAMLYIRPGQLTSLVSDPDHRWAAPLNVPATICRDRALRARILAFANLLTTDNPEAMEQEHHLFGIARLLARRTDAPGLWPHAYGKQTRLADSRDYIHAHLDRDMTIEELSAVANISKYHFIRMFAARFGTTPHQYVLNLRINRARTALEEGTTPTDTAQLLGFSDVSHLNRRFKRAYGITPKQYQKQLLP